jgi:hypothetical protein
VLLTSGAIENFIDNTIVEWLKLGMMLMKVAVPLRNINGTFKKSGKIT